MTKKSLQHNSTRCMVSLRPRPKVHDSSAHRARRFVSLRLGQKTKTANRHAVSVLGAESNMLVTQSLRVPCVVAQITDARRQMMNGRHSSG